MRGGQTSQHSLADGRQSQEHLSFIDGIVGFFDQTLRLHAIHEADRALMFYPQLFREFSHRNAAALCRSGNGQHGLMLVWRNAGRAREASSLKCTNARKAWRKLASNL